MGLYQFWAYFSLSHGTIFKISILTISVTLRWETLIIFLGVCWARWISTQWKHNSCLIESDFYSYFKVGVEGLVVSSGQLANVSDKAFVGLEVTSFLKKNLEERSFLNFSWGKIFFKFFLGEKWNFLIRCLERKNCTLSYLKTAQCSIFASWSFFIVQDQLAIIILQI